LAVAVLASSSALAKRVLGGLGFCGRLGLFGGPGAFDRKARLLFRGEPRLFGRGDPRLFGGQLVALGLRQLCKEAVGIGR